jgi:hypothetical protein
MSAETRCAPTVHEPSFWLRSTAAERVRLIDLLDVEAYGIVIAPLGSSGPPGSVEDRSCDRCGRYVPEGDRLHLLSYHVAPRIILCCGLCSSCAAKEGAR